MTRPDRRSAVHATPTGALWTVAGLLAAVLLAAAVTLINALTSSLSAPDTPVTVPATPPSAAPAIRYLVLITPLTTRARP